MTIKNQNKHKPYLITCFNPLDKKKVQFSNNFPDGECILNDDYTYNCSCRPGFVGDYCQHSNESACFSSPCANGGVCYLSNNNTFNDSASQVIRIWLLNYCVCML